MKSKILFFMTVCIIALSLVGCGGTENTQSAIHFKNCCKINLTGTDLVDSKDEKVALRVTYEVTNLTKENYSPADLVYFQLFQNEVELEHPLYNSMVDTSKKLWDMKPNDTLTVQTAFDLADMTEVELQVGDWLHKSTDKEISPIIIKINPTKLKKVE